MRINAKLIWSVVICEISGLLSLPFTAIPISTWYLSLHKASLNPPAWVFGPVWTLLYLLMGISLFFIWNKKVTGKLNVTKLLGIQMFVLQLVLNFFWPVLFFVFHQSFFSLWELSILWMTIAACIIIFLKISKPAAFILMPYLLWVTFAGYLNYMIWFLNH